MNYPKYDTTVDSQTLIFEFVSNGTNGSIDKAIKYECVNDDHQIYNLCFGDKTGIDELTGELKIDDIIVSNNGDIEKVLATVASSAYVFSEKYPERIIYFSGSTASRTRLYRKAINKEYEEISKTFNIFGAVIVDGKYTTVPFERDGNYDGFFITLKNEKETY